MKPRDLIETARDLVHSGNGKPRQANLRRAVSTVYYALFHALAKTGADLLVGGSRAARSEEAWRQAYRALDHGTAKMRCRNDKIMPLFPQPVQDFALLFVKMQEKRHKADYDPGDRFYKTDVVLDIDQALAVLDDFGQVAPRDRRAFAAYVVLKMRNE